jgi:signal transduction histidine kinase
VVSDPKPATQDNSKKGPSFLSKTINQQIVFVCASAAICIGGMQLSLYLLNGNFKSYSESVLSNNPTDREDLANGMMADRFRFRCRQHLSLSPLLSFLALMLLGLYLREQSNSSKRKLAKALLELKNGSVKADSASVTTNQESQIQELQNKESRSKDCQSSDNADQALAAAFNSLATSLKDLDSGHRQWVADTSHELRTPIAVLRAQVEAFQDGVHEITPRNLEVLHNEIMALSKLVDDLHWLAKYDVGQIRAQATALDINQTLQDVLESFEERREAKEIALDNQVPADEKLIVDGDPTRIRQVITNLVENSLRYTNKGGTLKISHSRAERSLKLLFEDTEPGVPDELMPKLFDRFFRVESSRSRTMGGSGLGLAICLNNMQMLGGTIEASHSAMGGLKIELTLPASQGNDPKRESKAIQNSQ